MAELSNEHRQPDLPKRGTTDRDYEIAFKLIAAVQRAVESPDFHAGVIYAYEAAGRTHQAALFTAAVEEQRAFAALEAEFGNETE